MKNGRTVASLFLALGFGFVTFVLLFVEPGMGFSEPADYFDPAKVLVGLSSVAWLVGDLVYLGFGVALAYLALSSGDRYLRASGLAAAGLFLLLVGLGRVLAELPSLIGDDSRLEAALLGLLSVRFAVLKTMVFCLGVFAWGTTRGQAGGFGTLAWRGFGYLVLATSIVFVFVFIPAPLVFTVWAVWFAFRQARPA